MMTNIQFELRKHHEEIQLESFKAKLQSFQCYDVAYETDFPSTLVQQLRLSSKRDTIRQSRLADRNEAFLNYPFANDRYLESHVGEVAPWLERVLLDSGIGLGRFFLSTNFQYFPWLDCRIVQKSWVQDILEVSDLNISLISHDKTRFLSIENGEHWFDAYWGDL